MIGQSIRIEFLLTVIGFIMAVNAKTRAMFEMLEPTTLPMAISGWFFNAAWRLTINSGAEVANDTTVTPITSVDTPMYLARTTLPLIR